MARTGAVTYQTTALFLSGVVLRVDGHKSDEWLGDSRMAAQCGDGYALSGVRPAVGLVVRQNSLSPRFFPEER